MKSAKKILVCYNEPTRLYKNYIGKEICSDEENVDLSETEISLHINEITSGLSNYYDKVEALPFRADVEDTIQAIDKISPDIIFNLVESVDGISNYEAFAAGVYELMGIYYTGNTPLTLSTCLDKARTKQILKAYGIRTPQFFIARHKENFSEESFQLKFPVILKLLKEDASIGISEFSVADDLKQLNERLDFLYETYRQEVIVEEYISGRELNVAVLGDKVLPVSEIDFSGLPKGLPKIVTYEGKWSEGSTYYKYTKPCCPALLDEETRKKVEHTALSSFKVLNCRDYARVDIRLSKNAVPYVIEVNPNPDISLDSGFVRAASAEGMTYPELLFTISNFAQIRKDNDKKAEA